MAAGLQQMEAQKRESRRLQQPHQPVHLSGMTQMCGCVHRSRQTQVSSVMCSMLTLCSTRVGESARHRHLPCSPSRWHAGT